MWIMDCTDNNNNNNNNHARNKLLRPLIPRPPFSSTTPCSFCTSQHSNILSIWNHHHHLGEYGVKREVGLVSSTRWNPTAEQLQALEELYRRGTRTPSAEQIQQIASRLRRFGKIEGKNVFYWFQNHKARERQKKRRQLEHLAAAKTHHSGKKRRYFEIEQQDKKLEKTEDSVSMNGSVMAEGKKDVWTQMELQQTIKNEEVSSSWKLKLDLSSFNNNFVHAITNYSLIKENDPTLQLFPTGNGDDGLIINNDVARVNILGNKSRPSEFIEFLPTK